MTVVYPSLSCKEVDFAGENFSRCFNAEVRLPKETTFLIIFDFGLKDIVKAWTVDSTSLDHGV